MANEIIKNLGFHHVALRCKDIEKSLFVWESDDGSRVKVFRIIESYNINLNNLE